ncbi:DUF1214 domain-containing protein [Demequina zhanjiangensis]|uniref:DUF1214 domain-containing protein n=1 Tax=Demequina zhanjiangensis TaxID=3051659 RepID=A0ABT8G0J7_9MICO|nr:DUF1214 domain-containing protein [Demequina sp. SYSU T00b26]MDN4472617.1 DUF1214 domain-containing protein [Demequina sp. SYSU T00b26]
MSIPVTVDNFVRAESDRMLVDIQRQAGGVNRLGHRRAPTPISQQTVIRMNRDTLYSFATVDLQHGVDLTLPEAGGRYLSAMLVNNDHLVPLVLHRPGHYRLTRTEAGTRYALVAIRILVDPTDPEDVAKVVALQDAIQISGEGGEDLVMPDYDRATFDATRQALLTLAAGMASFDKAFGSAAEVDRIHHLLGTAAGWGGLPRAEATYVSMMPPSLDADCHLDLTDVPVDAFWSVSVYDDRGFFVENPYDRYSVNSVTAVREPDGGVLIRFVHGEPVGPNDIPVPERWGTVLRLYRPRNEVLDGRWTAPPILTSAAGAQAA